MCINSSRWSPPNHFKGSVGLIRAKQIKIQNCYDSVQNPLHCVSRGFMLIFSSSTEKSSPDPSADLSRKGPAVRPADGGSGELGPRVDWSKQLGGCRQARDCPGLLGL